MDFTDAYARLVTFRQNLQDNPPHNGYHELYVKEYHSIVDLIEGTLGQEAHLIQYRIPQNELRHISTGSVTSPHNGTRKFFTEDRYCPAPFLRMKCDALILKFELQGGHQKIGFKLDDVEK